MNEVRQCFPQFCPLFDYVRFRLVWAIQPRVSLSAISLFPFVSRIRYPVNEFTQV